LASRKHWIAYALKARGAVLVDEGCAQALRERQSSLLPAGVLGVRGEFAQGDPVSIVGPDGREIARGLTRYAMGDVAKLAGAKASEIEARIGHYVGDAVIHRDDLVVL
jgi:glutamate 5-kinase